MPRFSNFTTDDNDEDDDEDFISRGLADFVAAVGQKLEQTQHDFLNIPAAEAAASTTMSTSFDDAVQQQQQTMSQQPSLDSFMHPSMKDSDDDLHQDLILQCNSTNVHPPMSNNTTAERTSAGYGVYGSSTNSVAFHQNNNNIHHNPLYDLGSPDLWTSPPPNPVNSLTDSEIKHQAMVGASPQPPPPPPTYDAAHFLGSNPHHSTTPYVSPPPRVMRPTTSVAPFTSTTTPISSVSPPPPLLEHQQHQNEKIKSLGVKFVHASSSSSIDGFSSSNCGGQEVVLDGSAATSTVIPHVPQQQQQKQHHIMFDATSSPSAPDSTDLLLLLSESNGLGTSPVTNSGVTGREQHLFHGKDVIAPSSNRTPSNLVVVRSADEGEGNDCEPTPSPLSMSSPSKASTSVRRKEELFAQHVRADPRLRASSPVYGLSPAPEEKLTLSQRLAEDAERMGLPPPTPETAVTGPAMPQRPDAATPREDHLTTPSSAVLASPVLQWKNAMPTSASQFPPVRETGANPSTTMLPDGLLSKSSMKTTPGSNVSSRSKSSTSPLQVSAEKKNIKTETPTSAAASSSFSSEKSCPFSKKKSPTTVAAKENVDKLDPKNAPSSATSKTSVRRPSPIAELLTTPSKSRSTPPVPTPRRSTPSPRDSPPKIGVQLASDVRLSTETPAARTTANKHSFSSSTKSRGFSQRTSPSPMKTSPSPMKTPPSSRSATSAPIGKQTNLTILPSSNATNMEDADTEFLESTQSPSPLSMSSPKFDATYDIARGNPMSASSTESSPPPRFSPPSLPKVKTAPRFTAEMADRLAKPLLKSPPPTQPSFASPLPFLSVKIETGRSSSNSAKRLPTSAKGISPQPARSDLTPTVASQGKPLRTITKATPTPSTTSVSATTPATNTSAPTARQKALAQSIASGFDSIKSSSHSTTFSQASRASQRPASSNVSPKKPFETPLRVMHPLPTPITSQNGLVSSTKPPATQKYQATPESPRTPRIFTAESAERLMRPTAARIATISATSPHRQHSSESGGTPDQQNELVEPIIPLEFRAAHTVPIPETSHLLHCTAVSEARKTTPRKATVRPPPPRRFVTGVSDRLMTRTAASMAGVLEGQQKIQERNRLDSHASHPNEEKPLFTSKDRAPMMREPNVHSKPKFSAEDGIAKARLRLQKAQQIRKKLSSIDLPVRPSNDVLVTVAKGMLDGSRPPRDKRVITIPNGPKFATSDRHLNRSTICRTDVKTLAQSVDGFGKGLRDDMSANASAGSNRSQRSLTIPSAPKFATDSRCGEKFKPPRSRADVSLAQSTDLLQNGLRKPYISSQKKGSHGPTIPHSPKFQTRKNRERPKSQNEKEEDEMNFFKSHPFKAKSTPQSSRGSIVPTVSSTRNESGLPSFMRPTRVVSQRTPPTILRSATASLKLFPRKTINSMKTSLQFTARIVPISTYQAPPSISPSSSQPLTTRTELFAYRNDNVATMTEASRRRFEELAAEREARSCLNRRISNDSSKRRTRTEPHETGPRLSVQSSSTSGYFKPTRASAFKVLPHPTGGNAFKAHATTDCSLEPFSPHLQTKTRVRARREFDVQAEQARQINQSRVQELEQQRLSEEEQDLYERRRLPVKEGGLIPVAKPVNAVFSNDIPRNDSIHTYT